MKELVDASSLKPEIVEGVDIMVVRELTGDVYFGTPKVRIQCVDRHLGCLCVLVTPRQQPKRFVVPLPRQQGASWVRSRARSSRYAVALLSAGVLPPPEPPFEACLSWQIPNISLEMNNLNVVAVMSTPTTRLPPVRTPNARLAPRATAAGMPRKRLPGWVDENWQGYIV